VNWTFNFNFAVVKEFCGRSMPFGLLPPSIYAVVYVYDMGMERPCTRYTFPFAMEH
jgi:hypothetical protein